MSTSKYIEDMTQSELKAHIKHFEESLNSAQAALNSGMAQASGTASKRQQQVEQANEQIEMAKRQLSVKISIEGEKKDGCYVATCVYGSYDSPEVWTLRYFRDETLDKSWYGKLFIRVYYKISPHVVKLFGEKKWFNRLWRPILDKIVVKILKKGDI